MSFIFILTGPMHRP